MELHDPCTIAIFRAGEREYFEGFGGYVWDFA